ncbi:CU044_5270 family protein [Streptomyces scabiei]|uniref:CU044_5270 family protein n=1 Tax=Streptomyces scabiei TaxID=1930 RepID=UPI0036EDC2F1
MSPMNPMNPMNPMDDVSAVERDELARLLPSPGNPRLSDDRLTRLEDHLMQELTGEATVRITGTREPAAARARTRRRFAVVGLPLGVAAAVLATVVATGVVGRGPADQEDAAGLLQRVAGAATDGEPTPVRDDQFLYIRTQGVSRVSAASADGGKSAEAAKKAREKVGKTGYPYRRTDWISVDGSENGLARTTWLEGQPAPRDMNGEIIDDPLARSMDDVEDMTLSADPDHSYYDELKALPTDPDKLYDEVWARTRGQGPTHEEAALEYITTMLNGARLLPELNGALFRVAAEIPGVRVVENAEDAAGRKGIGLAFGKGDDRAAWIFDKKTLKYLGSDEEALLEVGVVDEKGQEPTD